MSTFLSNLAARNLGMATVTQPRLPSRFEPVAYAGESGDLSGAGESGGLSGWEVSGGDAPTILERVVDRPTMAAPSPPHPDVHVSPANPVEVLRQGPSPQSPPITPITPDQQHRPPPLENNPPLTVSPSLIPVVQREVPAGERIVIERLTERLQSVSTVLTTNNLSPHFPQETHLEAIRETPSQLPPLPLPPSPLPLPTSPSAPTIQVTIGRVEVRAMTAAPPPPPKPKPTAQRMSLEDYLRKRDGGGR